jgi:hypothetical protein
LQQTPVENARAFVQAGQAAAMIDKVRVEGRARLPGGAHAGVRDRPRGK